MPLHILETREGHAVIAQWQTRLHGTPQAEQFGVRKKERLCGLILHPKERIEC
jgi:hypothetical protein